MSVVAKKSEQLIGNTPILELQNLKEKLSFGADIFAKLESFNPAGSIKDRAAKEMIDRAEKDGLIKKDSVIIEPTSGNTGIGLALVCASRGYKLKIVMPDSMSKERIMLMRAYGAEVVLTDGKLGMSGAIKAAKELSEKTPGSFIPDQFSNPANAEAHYKTTGPEIYDATDGKVDIFVSAVGTGGTITGTGRYLKEKNPSVKVVAVEPYESPVLSGGAAGAHGIQGIGAGFVPSVLDTEIYDEVIKVKTESAYESAKLLSKAEGVLAGISSGAALFAAIELAKRPENKDKKIVVIFPDTGDRYLSTGVFE